MSTTLTERVTGIMRGIGLPPSQLTSGDANRLGLPRHGQLPDSPSAIFSNPELQTILSEQLINFLKTEIFDGHIPNPDNISQSHNQDTRRLHLDSLNKPLEAVHLAPLFTYDQFKMGPISGVPILLSTKSVKPLGDGSNLAEFSWATGIEQGQETYGVFKALVRDQKAYMDQGAFHLSLTNEPTKYGNRSSAKGNLQINSSQLQQLNRELVQNNLPPFSSSSSILPDNSPKLERVDFNKDNQNFYIPIVLNNNQGDQRVIISNTIKKGSQGSIALIVYPDKSLGLIYNSRPLQNRPVELELSRGFPNQIVSELEQETGLDPAWITQEYKIWQGNHDHSYPEDQILHLDEFVAMNLPTEFSSPTAIPSDYLTSEKIHEFESISHVILTPKEFLEKIRQGEIRDAFTLSMSGKHFLESGSLILNPVYQNQGINILMEVKYFPQLGKYKLVLPEGHRDSGTKVGEVLPNSGMIIGGQNISSVNSTEIDKSNGYFVPIAIEKIPRYLIDPHACDVVTQAALFAGLYNQSVLIEPSRLAFSVSRRQTAIKK